MSSLLPISPILVVSIVLAFYLAWNLGANDVANSMGTSVGSKAITLRQALAIAAVFEFAGAMLLGQNVSGTLATKIVNPHAFAATPQTFLLGMLAVLLAGGVWLNLATFFKLPVSSSHAVVGAIAGFGWLAVGSGAIAWNTVGLISVTWIVTPIVSAILAVLFYHTLQFGILHRPDPLVRLNEWLPWLSAILFGLFGAIAFPDLLALPDVPYLGRNMGLIVGTMATLSLTLDGWKRLQQPDVTVEKILSRFQVVSACFVAFAHGSNDVGNAIAPLAAIAYVLQSQSVPVNNFPIPWWTLLLGAIGIVSGLAIWGRRVITTIGEDITLLQPSNGFCAELATATTVLIASRLGLPVSTSHALVGAVVGIGLLQVNQTPIQFKTLRSIVFGWFITLPVSGLISAVVFSLGQLIK